MKTWCYKEITDNAEREIKKLLRKEVPLPSHLNPYYQWAYGVFIGWEALCNGSINTDDHVRLKSLIDDAKKEGNVTIQ
jgi:hypothetical protein